MALIVGAAFVEAPSAHAQLQSGESMTLSPTSSKLNLDAGSVHEGKVTIVNDGSQPYDFLLYARPYSIIDNQYNNPNFTEVNSTTDVYKWVSFPKTKYRVEAGATVTAPYTMRIPKDAAPGGHYGIIFAETQPADEQPSGSMILRKKRVGSILYVTVNGDYKLVGNIEEPSTPFWQSSPPLRAYVTASNDGNADFTDSTRMIVKDVFGNTKYDVKKDFQVLPATSRTMTLEWSKALWFGFYKVETHQSFLGKSAKHESFVLMMPRFIPILLAVMILIGGIYAILRRRKN